MKKSFCLLTVLLALQLTAQSPLQAKGHKSQAQPLMATVQLPKPLSPSAQYNRWVLLQIDKVEHNLPEITHVAELVAERHLKGGRGRDVRRKATNTTSPSSAGTMRLPTMRKVLVSWRNCRSCMTPALTSSASGHERYRLSLNR
jgi:hypothetical protein